MSRTYLTFGDIAGKLHMLQIECTRCARKGRYSVAKLLAQHGHRGNMSKGVSDLSGDCHKRNAAHLHERCDLICPDLPKCSNNLPQVHNRLGRLALACQFVLATTTPRRAHCR